MINNRKCVQCGREYYACSNCIKINSWKNICCSRECYRRYVSKGGILVPNEIREERKDMEKVILRAELGIGKTISITGYDLELGKFDCTDGKTRTIDEFNYFIIPKDELKEISSKLFDKIEEVAKENPIEEVSEVEIIEDITDKKKQPKNAKKENITE